ncbi:hypothetical protein MKW98_001540 [Papaver atlanticum]|uniref:Uncharacterized protein n=1 Tax=Papaver atlanticum TaxID=357466 RepID=A0AAD4S895_9MAGN|nr:hypothetical protein MKW98_001540 [Papaver atlanticum]
MKISDLRSKVSYLVSLGNGFIIYVDDFKCVVVEYEYRVFFVEQIGRSNSLETSKAIALLTHLWFQRPPGAVSSSMLGLEAVNDSLDDFGFEDFHCLNDPHEFKT